MKRFTSLSEEAKNVVEGTLNNFKSCAHRDRHHSPKYSQNIVHE